MKLWKQQFLTYTLSASLLFCGFVFPVQAAQPDIPAQPDTSAQAPETDTAPAPTDPNAPPESYNWPVQSDEINGWPKGPQTAAETAILMDIDTKEILYAKNIDEKRYPASTTKIMTALLAIENGTLTDPITFSAEAVNNIEAGSTHIGVKPGEILTLEQSLYAVLLASANEVSSGVAEFIGGTIPAFVDMMNQKALALGCENTHFTNANGLHNDSHFTTAKDLAIIACAAYKNDTFRKITGTEYFIEPATNITPEERWLNNHHKMLVSGTLQYEGCTGGKTGYTTKAGNTLVTYAERAGMRLVSVVLADNAVFQYKDSAALLDYGFQNFVKTPVTAGSSNRYVEPLPFDQSLLQIQNPELLYTAGSTVTADLPAGISPDSLTTTLTPKDNRVLLDYYLNGQLLCTQTRRIEKSPSLSALLAGNKSAPADANTRTVSEKNQSEKNTSSELAGVTKQFKEKFSQLPNWKYLALLFLAAAFLFYLVLLTVKIKRYKKRKRKKRRMKRH